MSRHLRVLVTPVVLVTLLCAFQQQGGMKPEDVCTSHGVFVGPCFTIHGRMYGANGSPSYRIWIVGSNRIYGVHEGIGETACSPPAMLDSLIGEDKLIYADFVVRPVTPDTPGLMRMVCVASASHIVTSPAYFIHPRGAGEAPGSGSAPTPRPSPLRPDWCVGPNETVDSAFAVAQATNVLRDTLLPLEPHSVRPVEDLSVFEGFLVSLLPTRPILGGGGLVWVDGETGCPIVVKRYE